MSHFLPAIDETHDPLRQSWVAGADNHASFPIQNLPFGVFSPPGGAPRAGVAIGPSILDLAAIADVLDGEAAAAALAAGATLNAMLALGAAPRRALRRRLSQLLSREDGNQAALSPHLYDSHACTMHLPCAIGDYTDFYVGINHAMNIGAQFRPDNPLLPNYKHIPIGYHGRASSVRASGVPVRRPNGQIKPPAAAPHFGPSARLDYELELGVWIGEGNAPGTSIPIGEAAAHIAGFCLLNDWSARDIQAWEYQPLGPFLAKNFATTISCWIVSPEALAPFRAAQPARPSDDPQPLAYLCDAADQNGGGLDLRLEVFLRAQGQPPYCMAVSSTRHMYWTVAQMVAHHASGGCDLRPGDLLGTGTISGRESGSFGSMVETTLGGRSPITLPDGTQRAFLQDGDEVILRATANRHGFVSIGFGECCATIVP